MDELALNILDIAYNSIRANASNIKISITDSIRQNIIDIVVEDDGDGMSEETIERVTNPFYTTRTTRKVGLGIPLFKQEAEMTGGFLNVQSQLNKGTQIYARFIKDHIDTPVMGNIIDTMTTLIQADDQIDYYFEYIKDENTFIVDTKEIKDILGNEIKINEPEIILWLKDYMKEGLAQ